MRPPSARRPRPRGRRRLPPAPTNRGNPVLRRGADSKSDDGIRAARADRLNSRSCVIAGAVDCVRRRRGEVRRTGAQSPRTVRLASPLDAWQAQSVELTSMNSRTAKGDRHGRMRGLGGGGRSRPAVRRAKTQAVPDAGRPAPGAARGFRLPHPSPGRCGAPRHRGRRPAVVRGGGGRADGAGPCPRRGESPGFRCASAWRAWPGSPPGRS